MNRYLGIPTTLRGLLVAALCTTGFGLVAVPAARAAESPANKLQSVDVQAMSGQGLQLVLTTSGPAPTPLSFTIENPARISFDLPDTGLSLPQRRIDVRSGGLDSILAAEANGRSRLVLNLERTLPYQTRVEGNRIIVTLGENARAAAAPAATVTAAAAPARATGRDIKSIDFRRSSDGTATGRLIVKLSDPRTPINLRQQGNQILVDFVGADLPKNLQRAYDVADFATPVSGFNALHGPTGTQIVMNASGEFEQLAYQTDDQYVIEVQPRRAVKAQIDDKPVYSGERMSANFQDIETRTILQLIADQSGKSIMVTDSVKGSMTLSLNRIPWDQALDLVLQLQGLDKRVQDNVIVVGPTEELANREKARLAANKDIKELAPLRTEYLQINYAKAEDIVSLIQAQSGGGANGGKSLLSGRGSVTVDPRTNTLLIQDTSDSISNVRQLVSTLDIPVRQVRIEARIVVVSEDFTRDLGVRLGFTGTETNGATGLFATSGTAASVDTTLGSALDNLASTGSPYPVKVPVGSSSGAPASSRYNVNLPVSNPAGSLAWAILGKDYIVDLELSAAQSEGKGEVISQPSIVTANQKEAVISQGTEIPYQEAASSGAATIQFKPAKLELKVTPLITPDNRLILDISVSKDRVGSVIVTTGGVNVPAIDTSRLTTTVFLGDGQTVVLGGILETERRENEKKVPYLGDIPVLGHLFKSTGRVNNKDELLIFVTPKILREGVSVN
ncbi:MAG TPA: type IV pilus secretin PilQ [Steroidobacteraceae bacterium]|nr:type IV pilus secretin PilQ [Steroidobacteraceae bacterium]